MNASLLTMELHVNFQRLLQDFVGVLGDDNDAMIDIGEMNTMQVLIVVIMIFLFVIVVLVRHQTSSQ